MKNFLLGVALTLAGSSLALTKNEDGSVILDKGEFDQVRVEFYQLNYNFNLAIEQVAMLRKELDDLRKGKCL